MARSGGRKAVPGALQTLGRGWHTARQYLREWPCDGADRAAPCRVQREVEACFAPLLRWVPAWWQGPERTLAIDPTAKGEALVALVVSVVHRGLVIPGAWRLKPGGQPGPWMPDLVALPAGWAPPCRRTWPCASSATGACGAPACRPPSAARAGIPTCATTGTRPSRRRPDPAGRPGASWPAKARTR